MNKIKLVRNEDETHGEYCARYGREIYKANPDLFRMRSKIKYYKKIYKNNEKFFILLKSLDNKEINIKLQEVMKFHFLNKINKENQNYLKNKTVFNLENNVL